MFGWLRREPARFVEHRRRMSDAYADYPIYEPPHRQGPDCPRHLLIQEFHARGSENFSYFMEHRRARLAAVGRFLAKFDVTMGIDDTGLAAVSAWCPGNCGALGANLRQNATRQAFLQFSAPWGEERRGFNVIFDLGIFLGECVTARNQRLHWKYRGGSSDDGSTNLSAYHIAGFRKRRDWLDPIGSMYSMCGDDEVNLRFGEVGQSVRSDRLVGKVRDFSTR